MYYVIFYDQGERCISSKSWKRLEDAQRYASTISPSRKPRVAHEVGTSEEPLSCAYCGHDLDASGWYCPGCGAC